MRALQDAFDRLSLPAQVASAGFLLSLGLAAAAAAYAGTSEGLAQAATLAAGGALATAVAATLSLRAARSTLDIAQAARLLARDDAPALAQLPYKSPTAELHRATRALRRMVEAAQRRQQALEARNAQLGQSLQSRTQELSSLQDLSIGLAQQGDIHALVSEALGALEQTEAYSSASVWARVDLEPQQPVVMMGYRSQDDEIGGLALKDLVGLRLSRANLQRYEQIEADGQPIIENEIRQGLLNWLWAMVTDDARTSALYRGTRAWMAVPLKVRERVLGVLRVDHAQAEHFDPTRVKLLSAVASQTALAMRHAHLLAKERDVAVVTERNRIARELHDAVSQTLFAANLLAGTLARAGNINEDLRQQAVTLEKLNRSALAEMRMLMFELRPDALQTVGLSELLQQAAEALSGRSEIEVTVELQAENGPPGPVRVQLYRMAQEALSNIARHSGARHVHVAWTVPVPGQGRLRISDDGCGFDPELPRPGHVGLGNLGERAAELGATLALRTAPGDGTDLQIDLTWNIH